MNWVSGRCGWEGRDLVLWQFLTFYNFFNFNFKN